MYAILQYSGKQYRINEGQIIRFEKVHYNIGELFRFDQIIMVVYSDVIYIGNPFLSACDIFGEVVRHGRYKKIKVIKFQRRKHFRKMQGHRQWFTDVKINKINIMC